MLMDMRGSVPSFGFPGTAKAERFIVWHRDRGAARRHLGWRAGAVLWRPTSDALAVARRG